MTLHGKGIVGLKSVKISVQSLVMRMTSVRVGRQKSQTEELQCTSSLTRHEPNKQQEQYDMLFINDYFVYSSPSRISNCRSLLPLDVLCSFLFSEVLSGTRQSLGYHPGSYQTCRTPS